MTILEKIKFEEDWLSEVNLTKENIKIAFAGIRATVLEQQPCDDCISRQAVLDTEYQIKEINGIEYVMLSEVQMKIRKMPPVTPTYDLEEYLTKLWKLAYERGKAESEDKG